MAFSIQATIGRTVEYTFYLYESGGSVPVAIQADDVPRLKIGRGTGSPLLDIDNIAALAGGSILVIDDLGDDENPAQVRLVLAQDDTADLAQGVYSCELTVVDVDAAPIDNALLHVETGALNLYPSMGGDTGIS